MLILSETLGIKLMIRTESQENTSKVSEMLLNLFNVVIHTEPRTETLDDLTKEVKRIVDNFRGQHGVSSVEGKPGSVNLAIEMQYVDGILDLLRYLESGEAEDVFQNIAAALKKKFGEYVTITAELDDTSVALIQGKRNQLICFISQF